VAIFVCGAHGAAVLATFAGISAVVVGIIGVTEHGKLDPKYVTAALMAISVVAVGAIIACAYSRFYGSRELPAKQVNGIAPGQSFKFPVPASVHREWLRITFEVEQVNKEVPNCLSDVLLSVQVGGEPEYVEMRPGEQRDVRLGSKPPMGELVVDVTVKGNSENRQCYINVQTQGILHSW
jgi:hypothetical protein